MRRILQSFLLIAGAGAVIAGGATGAFFSDTETSSGNTFSAGAIDLKIDNESYYNGLPNEETTWELRDLTIEKFFNFSDIKPSDWGEDTISIHVDTNDAYMCANVTLTSDDENGCTEPEGEVDGTCGDPGEGEGELAQNVHFIWWADDGDNVLEDDENVISQGPIGALSLNAPYPLALADSTTNIWTGQGGPVPGDETLYIGKAWCFGTLTPAPLAQSGYSGPNDPGNAPDEGETTPEDGGIICDGTLLGNETQTDSLTADVVFEAVQARHNPDFQCQAPDEPPVFGACTAGQEFADAAGVFDQGTRKDGSPVLANRSVPSAAFGAPETSGASSDAGFPAGSFVSLGFKVAGGPPHGSLVLDFSDNVVYDGPGADLKVYEVTGGVYPDEKVMVEVSQDGISWVTAATSVTRDGSIDLAAMSGLQWARYVRLTDVSDISLFPNDADAYDVDAVEAVNCRVLVEN